MKRDCGISCWQCLWKELIVLFIMFVILVYIIKTYVIGI